MKKVETSVEMYRFKTIVYYGTKEEIEKEIEKLNKKVDKRLLPGKGIGFSVGRNIDRTRVGFVFIDSERVIKAGEEDLDYEILVHELQHVVDGLTTKLGICDTEARAYLMGYLFRKSMKIFKEG